MNQDLLSILYHPKAIHLHIDKYIFIYNVILLYNDNRIKKELIDTTGKDKDYASEYTCKLLKPRRWIYENFYDKAR